MPTIGRRWPTQTPEGDYAATCDICGVLWRRSQLSRKRDGLLYCPDDVDGDDEVTLSEANAAPDYNKARQHRGGSYPRKNYDPDPVYIIDVEDVES